MIPTHDLVWVEGADAVSFLDGLLSQAIEPMPPGGVRRSFLLAPNGKLRALLWILRDAASVGLVADRGLGARVTEDLTRFKLRVEVSFVDGPALHTVAGRSADEPRWRRDGDLIEVVTGAMGLSSRKPAGAIEMAPGEVDALRIELGEPVMGIDVDESTIPHETGLVAEAVDFAKGCYLGQELVARIDSRGRVNQRLVRVRTADGEPTAGAMLHGPAGPVGVLTTAAQGAGLGMVRREVEDGSTVEVDWGESTVAGTVGGLGQFASR